jgi:phenylalanine-4-hydroxylase
MILKGHIPMLADKELADLNQEIGLISMGLDEKNLSRLGTIYFYMIEIGSQIEDG